MDENICNIVDKAVRESYENGEKEGISLALNYLSTFIPEIENRLLNKIKKMKESGVND